MDLTDFADAPLEEAEHTEHARVIDGPIHDGDDLMEDGEPWPFAIYQPDRTIFADNASDIIGFLLPGYADLPKDSAGNDEALVWRWRCTVMTASDIQARLVSDAMIEGRFDPEDETEAVVNVLAADKTIPVTEIEPGLTEWDHPEVALVLIATDYAMPSADLPGGEATGSKNAARKFTDRTPITGNVIYLDPSDEIAFLHSLTNAGAIQFRTHNAA